MFSIPVCGLVVDHICLTMSASGHGILESCDAREIASIFNNECWKMSQDTKVCFLCPDNSTHTASYFSQGARYQTLTMSCATKARNSLGESWFYRSTLFR